MRTIYIGDQQVRTTYFSRQCEWPGRSYSCIRASETIKTGWRRPTSLACSFALSALYAKKLFKMSVEKLLEFMQ